MMKALKNLLMMCLMVGILMGCQGQALQRSPVPKLTLQSGWLQTFNEKGEMVDITGMQLQLHNGDFAYIRDGMKKVPLKCMPAEDADKMETYIKFLKRR
jgi:hypothetical protein